MSELAPYDLIANQWAADRALLEREKPYVERFMALAMPGGHLLDLGCGSGAITRQLLDRGFRVTGVDASAELLRLARSRCPAATFVHADMLSVELPDRYHGIVAWDSVFHVPKARHGALFRSMHRWLEPGAPLLLSLGGSDGEFTAPMFGIEFFYSAHAPDTSVGLLGDAGFAVVLSEVDDPSSRGHLAVICRKPSDAVPAAGLHATRTPDAALPRR